MQKITLKDGSAMPALGLGTWKSDPGQVAAAVRHAIRAGYRHIDCAPVYGNETEVGDAIGAAIDAGEVAREDLWVTSKLWNDSHAPETVIPALEQSLADLGLEYLDLFLIHWPVVHKKGVMVPDKASDLVALDAMPLSETWSGMLAAVDAGLARHIGVSNCSAVKLAALLAATTHPPEVNQVELHPYLQQEILLAFCRDADVAVTAYSPLGSRDRNPLMKARDEPDLLGDPVIAEIAREVDATPAQVLIAWSLARGTAVIPKSVTPSRIDENFAAARLALTETQMQRIGTLERGRRFVTARFLALPGSPYTYRNIWDEATV